MKKKRTLKIIALLLAIALLAATYAWAGCRKKNERLVESVYLDSLRSRLVLSDMADFLEHSIEHNASDAYLRLQLIRYEENVLSLGNVFSELYDLTGERKYSTLSEALSSVDGFLTDVSNDEPEKMRTRVKDNLEALKRLQELFKELSKYQKPEEIPESLAEELLNASRELR
ncbi:hypothetical protein A3L09_03915 [Thermococcus profundus]|uniref:Uncharacterized protein n=1 Tax=Thermococcus profundus TaxID=49899 RepID=A0A2Z2MAJ8_THEPR|nr:hypothetical protein [Thermococcus profundus]ASJ02459.1 hypothetical protein A3L09_03915 [Thermococcus profundus]